MVNVIKKSCRDYYNTKYGLNIDYKDFTKNDISNEPIIQVPNDVIEWRDLSPKFIELTIRRLPE